MGARESKVKVVGATDSDKVTVLNGWPWIQATNNEKGQPGRAVNFGSVQNGSRAGSLGQTGQRCTIVTHNETVVRNCKELQDQGSVLGGWYIVYPDGIDPMLVLCDFHTDGGGWIVIQRRWDGSVDFNRDWDSYRKGFGNQLNEFWLGNDNIHILTSNGTWELHVDLFDYQNTNHFAKYASFRILGEDEKYRLLLGAYNDGNAGDSMSYNNNTQFSTLDQDNDKSTTNCAKDRHGAWWYGACSLSNLNSLYLQGKHNNPSTGINWNSGKGHSYSYKRALMLIRPV
ncbi:ficolin-1-like [Bombina bombina]|uniref:ficolin-1-like n=1 Tax=Bombina bombina TaxID=8345 RepID=UPI00235B2E04|nr:ficolin-1-like [Bombina bombina]